MSACRLCDKTAMSKPHDAVGHTADAESHITQADPHLSHRWIHASAQRRTRTLSARSILRDLGVIAIAVVIVFVLVLLIHYTAIGKPLFEFGSAQPEPNDEIATYLPSAATLQFTQGDGLIVIINNHAVAPVSDRQQEPMSSRP
jgi:hypothetical protein